MQSREFLKMLLQPRAFATRILVSVLLLCGQAIATAQVAPSTVVAKRGEAMVTLADVDAFAQTIPDDQRAGFFDNPTRLENLLTTLLLKKQLAAEARKLGLEKDPVVATEVELAVDETLAKVRMRHFREELAVPDLSALAKEEYLGHKEKFVVPGTLEVKHVLVSTKNRSEEDAKAIADTVETQARANPDQFDALVEKYSEDESKATNGGLMKDAGSNRYMPAFADAAKALKNPGDISPVVKTQYGFHIVKLITRTNDQQKAFADVEQQIESRLRSDYIDKAVRNHSDTLRSQPIDATPEIVASLRTRYGDATPPAAPAPAVPAGSRK